MIDRRDFTAYSSALGSLCFADNVVLALATFRKTNALGPRETQLLEAADVFFSNVISGYKWSERPAISATSVQSAAAFADAVNAVAFKLNIERPQEFLDYVGRQRETVRQLLKDRSATPERLQELQDFFTTYGYSQLERTDEIADRTGKRETGPWLTVSQ